ncbi:tRNA-dihydrouridine(16/17) synthase [NAD(P)(+)] [Galdieria sulphuraria]|nr:tRNA-dihydrouridine(16/17) synthase [NAD(P)(+)] [Galdieria sulphuraria]
MSSLVSPHPLAFLLDIIVRMGSQKAHEHYKQLGSPKWICAPMVDQSELPFRLLCRRYGVELCYTPMLHSRIFLQEEKYRKTHFTTCEEDRPLVVQFCANDPDIFVRAAELVQFQCDAVDLNLGCPQHIAKKVSTAANKLSVPVWCKIRIFDDVKRTIEYARMIENAGCQVLAVHGRTREQKGKEPGPANWDTIRAVREALSIPVLANGSVSSLQGAKLCLEHTGCLGVLSATHLLDNPKLFTNDPSPDKIVLSQEYLELTKQYPVELTMIRGHLFRLWKQLMSISQMQKLATASHVQEMEQVMLELKSQKAPNYNKNEYPRDFEMIPKDSIHNEIVRNNI